MASTSSTQVRVAVRIRPLTPQEIGQGANQVVEAVPPCVGIGERRFTYDAVFDSSISQSDLYSSVSSPLLKSFLDGYNATVSKIVCFLFVGGALFATFFGDKNTHKSLRHCSLKSSNNNTIRLWLMDKLDQARLLQWEVKLMPKEKKCVFIQD